MHVKQTNCRVKVDVFFCYFFFCLAIPHFVPTKVIIERDKIEEDLYEVLKARTFYPAKTTSQQPIQPNVVKNNFSPDSKTHLVGKLMQLLFGRINFLSVQHNSIHDKKV